MARQDDGPFRRPSTTSPGADGSLVLAGYTRLDLSGTGHFGDTDMYVTKVVP